MDEKKILAALKDIGVELHKTDRVLARLGKRIGELGKDVRLAEKKHGAKRTDRQNA